MKKYEFEFENNKYAAILFLLSFSIFFILIFILIKFENYLNFYFIMLISAGVPFLFFKLNKHRIKQNGYAILYEDNTQISKIGNSEIIHFTEIKNYQINTINESIGLLINLKTGKKISVGCNSNFCNTVNFENYCEDLEINIEKYFKLNNLEKIRVKTLFERKWVYPTLITITGAIIILVIYLFNSGREVKFSLLAGVFAPLLTLWGSYYSTKKRINNLKMKNNK